MNKSSSFTPNLSKHNLCPDKFFILSSPFIYHKQFTLKSQDRLGQMLHQYKNVTVKSSAKTAAA